MRVLLVSTYDLGRQPFGLASPAAWLGAAGVDVACVDVSRDHLGDEQIREASLVAFYLPMHTATRLAGPLIDRARSVNPDATLAAYGLYAPLNAAWLRDRGVAHVIGPEAEQALVDLATSREAKPTHESSTRSAAGIPRLQFLQPDRTTLPPLARYAALQMPDGTRRVVGHTEATRGCKHLCRHCPIVPVYDGAFRVVPIDVVLADIRAQVAAGAQHVTFGDPDFLNGPTHARRLVERLAREFREVTYDVTIKIEHLLQHEAMLPLLRDTGCLFITSAVESLDDGVLERLRKGHTRADVVRAVAACRAAGVALSPTFVPFTPWTTPDGYVDLLEQLAALDLVEQVAPIQLAIRLLVTAESKLLELPDVAGIVAPFDPQSLTWPWRHADPNVDRLQQNVMSIVASMPRSPRSAVFAAITAAARNATGGRESFVPPESFLPLNQLGRTTPDPLRPRFPYMTEQWYCCAEPGPEQFDLV